MFATLTGRPIDGRNMLRWFKHAATAAGIERNVWVHQLRHTTGTRAAEVGRSALEVAALLGHAQASTSERYIHLTRGTSLERAEQLATAALAKVDNRVSGPTLAILETDLHREITVYNAADVRTIAVSNHLVEGEIRSEALPIDAGMTGRRSLSTRTLIPS